MSHAVQPKDLHLFRACRTLHWSPRKSDQLLEFEFRVYRVNLKHLSCTRVCSWPWQLGNVNSGLSHRKRDNFAGNKFIIETEVDLDVTDDESGSLRVISHMNSARVGNGADDHPKNELREAALVAASRPKATYSAASLAYFGDCVFELYARKHFLFPPRKLDSHYNKVMSVVCCEAQNSLLSGLLESNFLTETERDIVRWGKNSSSGSRKAKDRAGSLVYSGATALETLVGYLYLKDENRLNKMMEFLGFVFDGSDLPLLSRDQSKDSA